MRQNDTYRSDRIHLYSTSPQHCLTQIHIPEKYRYQYIKIVFYLCREAYSAAGIGDASVRGLGAVQYQRLELCLLL